MLWKAYLRRVAQTPARPLPSECPECHARLETGVLLGPRGIYWADRAHWSILFTETVVSMWAWAKMPNVPAARCRSCGLGFFRADAGADLVPRPSGFRYACPGCGGDVYAGERTCPACGARLPENP